MSSAARSMQVWAIYTTVIGLALLLVPNTVLGVFQIEETTEVWVRVVGAVALSLSVVYWYIVSEGSRRMFQATVYDRVLFVGIAVVLAFTTGPWQLILFAIVDAAGALWTHLANRQT